MIMVDTQTDGRTTFTSGYERMPAIGSTIVIPEGARLNVGPADDSDSLVVEKTVNPLLGEVVGNRDGILQVKVHWPQNSKDKQIFYYSPPFKPVKSTDIKQ